MVADLPQLGTSASGTNSQRKTPLSASYSAPSASVGATAILACAAKTSDWLAGGGGQDLEQACEISLTFARLDRSLHEVNVRIRNSVIRTSILAPAYKLLGDHGICFQRGLIATVILGRNSLRHVGEDGFHGRHHPLDRLQKSSGGQVFTLPYNLPAVMRLSLTV